MSSLLLGSKSDSARDQLPFAASTPPSRPAWKMSSSISRADLVVAAGCFCHRMRTQSYMVGMRLALTMAQNYKEAAWTIIMYAVVTIGRVQSSTTYARQNHDRRMMQFEYSRLTNMPAEGGSNSATSRGSHRSQASHIVFLLLVYSILRWTNQSR